VISTIAIGLLGGCATIVEGTDQTLSVSTTPAGATCELIRGGTTIGLVNPTPGSINVEKSQDDITVKCEKEEHQSAARSFASQLQGMTFGNILFGGIIGVAVDASSGAMHEYEPSIHLVLAPNEFASLETRDAFFDAERARIESEAASAITSVREDCDQREPWKCDETVEAIEGELTAQLSENEVKRNQAKIAGD
jgi:hypothetical protein